MGSFRPPAGNGYLHPYYNFAKPTAKTASRSLHHSCRSELTHQSMSPFHGLESKQIKGRISTAAPQILAYLLQSLRPILHITCPDSMISYSKGSRGLFVPSRVIGIFTDTTISPSSWLRQCPDRYTIRAGRNLPDKEFRYLRTVIVAAAVYWGFSQCLRITSKHLP